MVFTKFVEVGRVVKVNYGPDEGKLAVVVEILNDKRVLIDGPTTGVKRQLIPIRRLTLTKFAVKSVLRGSRSSFIKTQLTKFALTDKYAKLGAATKQIKKEKRAQLSDFDRFKVTILRKRRSALLAHLVKAAPKKGAKAAPKKK
ncbi:hypothetical protein pb186bvf_004533 [Paramecium bursaria]